MPHLEVLSSFHEGGEIMGIEVINEAIIFIAFIVVTAVYTKICPPEKKEEK